MVAAIVSVIILCRIGPKSETQILMEFFEKRIHSRSQSGAVLYAQPAGLRVASSASAYVSDRVELGCGLHCVASELRCVLRTVFDVASMRVALPLSAQASLGIVPLSPSAMASPSSTLLTVDIIAIQHTHTHRERKAGRPMVDGGRDVVWSDRQAMVIECISINPRTQQSIRNRI